MAGEEEMEDDDDDDVDFNPYLQRSPSPDRESEDAEEEGVVERQEEDGLLAAESVQQLFRGSEQFVGEFDGDDNFFELASDDYEEEEFEDVDQEEMFHEYYFAGGSKSGKYSTKNVFKGKDKEYLEGCLNGIDYETCAEEDATADHNLDGLRKPLNEKECSFSSGNIVYDALDKPGKDAIVPHPRIGMPSEENMGSDKSEGEGEGMVDAISKRTRAHYSLTDMSLDQLETFLQESDEDEYFQTVDDEEEYRKFLLAVQENEDPFHEKPEQSSRKDDEDDEEEDVDFEIEIEEALESDDTSESLRKRKPRRPETREKRRQRAQTKGHLLGQSTAPLRHLLPHGANLADEFSFMERRKAMAETVSWPLNAKRKAPVNPANGFTAHQIGQLYCLIHEHVQLLVQVFSLCILEPARQQMAMDTQRMLLELVEKRELLLSWKKTAFPDFCFRPPYTHPSLVEGEDHATCFQSLSAADISTSTSTSCGQSTRVSSSIYPGYYYSQGSVGSSSATCSQNVGQNTAVLPRSYSVSRTLEPASQSGHHYAAPEHFSQQTAVTPQSWQEKVRPFAACPDQGQETESLAEGISSSQTKSLSGALTGSFVDPTSLLTNQFESADDLFRHHSLGSSGDPASVTGNYFHSSVTPQKAPVQLVSHNHGSHPNLGLPPAMVQTATSSKGAQMCTSTAGFLSERVKFEWAPVTSGPVRSLLDVAPLALVRDFLTDVSCVVQVYRHRHVETGAYHSRCEREPLFAVSANDEQEQNIGRNLIEGTRSRLFGGTEVFSVCVPRPQVKKTMAAALVESTKKQSLALVPKDAAVAVQRFLPYFNKAFFPHKPPPVATASRLLFTDAEDELLAMGLMMYNTDWKAIQQRYLPSKSMHQIFVRQKNRSSARAPENSIKAVRRMKSSPLTHSEKSAIQEGLGIFKHDWNKVWQYCVPHRDPAVLPRQWRIAVGTQKSYKTSETSKERRRLYEANRRQRIAAKKANDTAGTMEEDAHLSCTGTSLEGSSCQTGNKDADDPDNAYIREAFLDDWCPRISPVVAPEPTATNAGRRRKLISSLTKKKKAKVELELHLSSSSPWLDSQTVNTISQSRKQTVKLAPGLPSVKLPPCVQVLSQSQAQPQQPCSLPSRISPVTTQWGPVTPQGLDKLELSIQANHLQSSALSHCATEAATALLEGGSHQSTLPASYSIYKKGQTKMKKRSPAIIVSGEQVGKTKQGRTPTLDKKMRRAQVPPTEMNQRDFLLWQPIGDLASANDFMSQCHCLSNSVSPVLHHCSVHGHPPPFRGEAIGSGLPSIQRLDSLPAQTTKEAAAVISVDQVVSDHQDPMASSVTSMLVPVEQAHSPASRPCATASQPIAMYAGCDVQRCDGQNPSQASPSIGLVPPPAADWNGMPASDAMIAKSVLQMDLTQRQVGKRNARVCAGQGGVKAKRNPAKKNKKLVYENIKESRNVNQGIPSSSSLAKASHQLGAILLVEGMVPATSTSSHRRYRGKNTGKSRSRKSQKAQEACVEKDYGSQEPHLEHHVIVMEQEELSDSEDEADAGVEFEHEEMGDSDKDAEVELRNAKHSRACKSK